LRYEIGVLASHDLREIHRYGLSNYGGMRADAYLDELFDKFEHIARWPYTARERNAKRSAVRLLRQRAHNILYSVETGTVTILRIFHHSANWIDLL
jgi:toxin ParE1/3/4